MNQVSILLGQCSPQWHLPSEHEFPTPSQPIIPISCPIKNIHIKRWASCLPRTYQHTLLDPPSFPTLQDHFYAFPIPPVYGIIQVQMQKQQPWMPLKRKKRLCKARAIVRHHAAGKADRCAEYEGKAPVPNTGEWRSQLFLEFWQDQLTKCTDNRPCNASYSLERVRIKR